MVLNFKLRTDFFFPGRCTQIFSLLICIFISYNLIAHDLPHNQVTVNFKIREDDTGKITPAMICIQNAETKEVVTPPYGKTVKEFATVDDFVSGIMFGNDKNWIGPVRRTTGKGMNVDRSFEYNMVQPVPFWRAPAIYQVTGDFSVNLKPGKWLISISHGYEYEPVILNEIIVPKNDHSIDVHYNLKRWINMPALGWYSGDVHVHHPTTKPEYRSFLLNFAKAEDLHVVNTLNMGYHHSYGSTQSGIDYEQQGFGKKFRSYEGKYCLVSGQEDPRSTYGHIIGLNISEMVRDTTRYDYYDLIFEKIRKQPGALIGFAHLAISGVDLLQGMPWLMTTKQIDFVELLQLSKMNVLGYYDYLNLGFKLSAAAGSDLPWGATIGEVRTYVYTGKRFSVDKWFEGLKRGNTFVSNGPMIFFDVDGNMPGSEVKVKNGKITLLRVQAVSNQLIGQIERVVLFNNDGMVKEVLNPGKSNEISFQLSHEINKSQWLTAAVYCKNGAVAHTSPIYYSINDQPTWSTEKAGEIIHRHLQIIDDVESETNDTGIVTRLNKARLFYRTMMQEMNLPVITTDSLKRLSSVKNSGNLRNIEKVAVKGGEFCMGDESVSGDQPLHKVRLSDFKISKTEVTNHQFAQFLNACNIDYRAMYNSKNMVVAIGKYSKLEYVDGKWQSKEGFQNHPVVNVTWWGASEFCKWAGGRLPTEAEWEYAARGGVHSKNFKYAGSNNILEVGYIGVNSINKPQEVAKLAANELGLYDMSGNLSEWCSDWYGDYPNDFQQDPQGPETGEYKIYRGGAYYEVEQCAKTTHRNAFSPDGALIFIGFRVVFEN